uniref:Tumor necrosis factor receptor superfamily, member 1A n=1 Tax=Iconisemion striatum TaxID=60296 RepID=A0A1A7Z3M1_9TELE
MMAGRPSIILLLFECTFIFASTLNPGSLSCPVGDYENKDGVCCNKCPAGFKLVEECRSDGHRSNCTPCPPQQFSDQINNAFQCRKCRTCKESRNERRISACKSTQNTICGCKEGYYKSHIDSETVECLKCSKCKLDETKEEPCTEEKNTVCGCKENFYRVGNKCEPCRNCTTGCSQHCMSEVKKPDPKPNNNLLLNVVAGCVVVVLVLLVLVVLITFLATKRFTKKKMLSLSSQPSDVSVESVKHLLISAEGPPENICLKAAAQSPVGELELSMLPDCIPLEIKIPELIYAVLDLVPVLQVKQLVRCLGVRDTEIEQAEMDNRSCREAYYQMLRVWAERGSQELGGGRGEMLHRPLLEELLDKLRQMHLGRAAEELETKYPIQ